MFNRRNLKLAVTRAQDFDRSNFRPEFRDSDDDHYIAARNDKEEGGRRKERRNCLPRNKQNDRNV